TAIRLDCCGRIRVTTVETTSGAGPIGMRGEDNRLTPLPALGMIPSRLGDRTDSRVASASPTSSVELGRFAGSFCSRLSTNATRSSGTLGLISRIGFGVLTAKAVRTAMVLLPGNGTWPEHIV